MSGITDATGTAAGVSEMIGQAEEETAETIALEHQETVATMKMQMAMAEAEEEDNNMMEKQTTAIDMFDKMMQAVWKVASKIAMDAIQ